MGISTIFADVDVVNDDVVGVSSSSSMMKSRRCNVANVDEINIVGAGRKRAAPLTPLDWCGGETNEEDDLAP